jgi:putative glutamine amidotransferase
MDPGDDVQYLSRQYADAVAASGGIPTLLPLLEYPRQLRDLVQELDGIVLTGSSSDVDPAAYGAAREAACGPVQALRDRLDFELLEQAFAARIPVLGICYGLQSLNVFLGGTLIQDIPSALGSSIRHQDPETRGGPAHPIDIVPGSVLHRLAGGLQASVNSTHHQAIDRIAEGLEVVARAPDGVVEAVVGRTSDPAVLAVQWHPERSFAFDPLSRAIFEFFLAQCHAGVPA